LRKRDERRRQKGGGDDRFDKREPALHALARCNARSTRERLFFGLIPGKAE
jgi:hypothetical protein